MNRIRKVKEGFQVLVTPDITVSPDSAIIVGNWSDEYLRNYNVITFNNLNDAQVEAFKYPDIDWHRLVVNHQYIFNRLNNQIRKVINDNKFNVDIKSKLMDSEEFKNIMFERVLRGGERFNLKERFNDLICFTIVNPWSDVLHRVSKVLENHREYLHRDDLRIRKKKIIDGKIICLFGQTEYGTTYEIKLIPSLLHQWCLWKNTKLDKKFINFSPLSGPSVSPDEEAYKIYNILMQTQNAIDNGPVLI